MQNVPAGMVATDAQGRSLSRTSETAQAALQAQAEAIILDRLAEISFDQLHFMFGLPALVDPALEVVIDE